MSRDVVRSVLVKSGVHNIRETSEGFTSTCPFHADRHQSFAIREDGVFLCYAAECGARGNLYAFLVKAGRYSHERATELAGLVGARSKGTVDDVLPRVPSFRDRKRRHSAPERMSEADLRQYTSYCPVYMLNRGFTKDTLKCFEVGYDHEVHRVVIPIRGPEGRLAGLIRRATDADEMPKYKVDVPAGRGMLLFNLHRVKGDHVVLVEGPLDCMWAHQCGVSNTVALLGTSFSKDQARLVRGRFDEVTLMLDNDASGFAGTLKIARALAMSPGRLLVADRFEGGKDPADNSPEEVRRCINGALTYPTWYVSRNGPLSRSR